MAALRLVKKIDCLDVMQKWLCIWRCEIIESKLLYGSIEMQILKS